MAGNDIGYYTLPVLLSFDGVDRQVNASVGKALGTAGKKGGQDFAKAFTASSEADLKKLGDTYEKVYNRAADAAGKLRSEEAKLKDLQDRGVTGGRLVAQAERAEKARRDEARAVRTATDAYKDLERAQKAVDDTGGGVGGGLLDKLKGAAGSARSSGGEAASGFVEGFGGPIAALGTKAGPIGLALAAAAGLALGAGGLIAKQVMAGIDAEAAADKVQARFGLDDATMAQFGDAAGKAYAQNFGDSIQGNVEAAAVALQNGLLPKDATEEQTRGVISQLSTVSTILGVEIPEAARSAGQLMRTGFAKDFSEAADLIVAGSQSGLNISDDWLDTVNEYSTQFRKLGVTGPEALGLLSQAVRGGARDTDVAADALKEFSIRAVDGSKTTTDAFQSLGLNADEMAAKFAAGGTSAHDAFGQVLNAVRGVKDPVEQSRIAVELFGTQAEDLGAALNQFDLSTAVQQLGQVDGAAQKASDTLGGNTASSVESAKRSIELATTDMQKSLAEAFGPQLQQVATWVSAHQDEIVSAFKWMAGGATEFGAAVITMAGGVLKAGGQVVMAVGDMVGFVLDGFEQITGAAATIADAVGADGVARDLREASTQLGVWSDQFHGWGEGLNSFGDDVMGAGLKLHNFNGNMSTSEANAANAAAQVEHVRQAIGALPDGKQIDINAIVIFKDTSGLVIPPDQLRTPTYTPAVPGESRRPVGGRAFGGAISGPGGPTSDVIPIWASNGEHMWTAEEVQAVGGQDAMYRMRAAARSGLLQGFAAGGAIGPDVQAATAMVGTPYSQRNRNDCSGMVARVIARTLGLPESGLMSTKNAKQWLSALGFQPGIGGPGQISVGWYDHGPNPNDGHMAMTLSDGTNAEAGGKNGVFTVGAGAEGADSPQFDQHMFLPTVFGEGPAGSVSSSASSGFSGGSGGTVGVGPNGEAGTWSAPDPKQVREAQQKVADADQRVSELEDKQRELKSDAKESERKKAQADVDKAKREAQDARDDLAAVQRGKFTESKGSSRSSGGQGGLGQFGELGGIAGSFLKETFGFDGSFFPDISQLGVVQMAGNLLNAFRGPLQGAVDGQLGIQQPGWQPGMPVNGVANDTGIGTSNAAFGMPDVAVPPMPPPGVHQGSGALPGPAPQQNITIDQSIKGNVGSDPAQLFKARDAGLARAMPRIPAIR